MLKKRKLEDDSEEREYGALRKMSNISARFRDYLFDPAQLVGREVAKVVQTRMAEMEDVLLEALMENERLIGMTHAVCDMNSSVKENVSQPTDDAASYAKVTMATLANKYENAKKRHAIVVRPKEKEMSSEKVKEIVLKESQPKMKDAAQVSAVRMIRSGGIAIETTREQDLTKIKTCTLFEKSGLRFEAPRKIGPKIIIYDVPEELTNVDLIKVLYARNLTDILNPN